MYCLWLTAVLLLYFQSLYSLSPTAFFLLFILAKPTISVLKEMILVGIFVWFPFWRKSFQAFNILSLRIIFVVSLFLWISFIKLTLLFILSLKLLQIWPSGALQPSSFGPHRFFELLIYHNVFILYLPCPSPGTSWFLLVEVVFRIYVLEATAVSLLLGLFNRQN